METEVNPCPICLDEIKKDLFKSYCAKPHHFHIQCIQKHAKTCLADAVSVRDGTVHVKQSALARCPVCRADMVFVHRQSYVNSFYLIGGSQTLMELGTVRPCDKAVQISSRSYKRIKSMTA